MAVQVFCNCLQSPPTYLFSDINDSSDISDSSDNNEKSDKSEKKKKNRHKIFFLHIFVLVSQKLKL